MVLTQDKIDRVLAFVQSGKYSKSEIVRLSGVSDSAIKRLLRIRAITLPRGRSVNQWTQAQVDECISLYHQGLSEMEIQRRMGVTQKSTMKYLRAAGLPSRGKGSPGEKNYFWNGGYTVEPEGYVLVYSPNHPYRNVHNQVRRHRLVMENMIGRYLLPTEVVHHRNDTPGDDRPENLELYASNAEHLAATLKGKRPKWTADGLERLFAAHKARHIGCTGDHPILGVDPSQLSSDDHQSDDTLELSDTELAA